MKNVWVKCLSTSGLVRGIAIEMTELVQAQGTLRGLKDEALQLYGESIIGAMLVASYCKKGERINLNIRGNGDFIRQAVIDASAVGTFRGYVIPVADPSASGLQIVDAARGLWGEGLLTVLRTKELTGEEPYQGHVPLVTGHLAKDLTFYWAQSEQVASAVGITVQTKGGRVQSARGFMVQAMPGAQDTDLAMIENHLIELPKVEFKEGGFKDPTQLLAVIFQDMAFSILEERELKFYCECSQERVERALTLAGVEEMQAILVEQGQASVTCDFCLKEYRVSGTRLKELMN